jgi:hypothetical protein
MTVGTLEQIRPAPVLPTTWVICELSFSKCRKSVMALMGWSVSGVVSVCISKL